MIRDVRLLYSTTEVGRLLGGLHANDVLKLVQSGKLKAKSMVVRGQNKKPRKYITASEIERFVNELPDADPPGIGPARKRRLSTPRGIMEEFKGLREYV